jgi:HK97 family phage portal protein
MSAINSMSALAAFPWVQASVSAIADDLSMLPMKATKGRGKNAEPIEDHPVLDLLEQPTSRTSGVMLRRQLLTDLVLTGDAYLLVAGSPDPAALIRLHPERVRIVPSADGQAAAYDYQQSGQTVRYGWEQVLHIRATSWEDGPQGLYGTGAIRALANDLTTEKKAADLAANSADTGRPTGVFSPSEDGDRWNKQQVGVLRDAFDKQMKGTGGALFMGGPVKYEAIGWSPRDMEYQATRALVREAVIASIGVTPTRIGLPSANFATAREQNRIYWTSLQARAALVDSAFTRLARMFRGSETVTVSHDFSSVEALQESRSDRQNRVQAWWLMGIPLSEAAALEGFDNITPAQDVAAPAAPAEEPPAKTFAPLAKWLVLDGGEDDPGPFQAPRTEDGRAALWRSFIEKMHTPHERRLTLEMRRYLRGYGARTAKRMKEHLPAPKAGAAPVVKRLDAITLDKILDVAAERQEMLGIFRPTFRKMLREAIEGTAAQLPVTFEFTPERIDALVNAQIGDMIKNTTPATRSQVGALIRTGLTEGQSIGQMQRTLIQSQTFSPARALTIARTETTRAVSAGSIEAMKEAEGLGVKVQKEWVSARDGSVRDSHVELDGERVPVGQQFEGLGGSGSGPGEFGIPEEDINCRCTTVPFVEGVS